MINRVFACAAIAAIGAFVFTPPVKVYARGFTGHAVVTPLGFRAHHAFRHNRNNRWPGGWIAAYPADYYEPVAAIPEQIAPAYTVVPRCTPRGRIGARLGACGGERQITIRRCSP